MNEVFISRTFMTEAQDRRDWLNALKRVHQRSGAESHRRPKEGRSVLGEVYRPLLASAVGEYLRHPVTVKW